MGSTLAGVCAAVLMLPSLFEFLPNELARTKNLLHAMHGGRLLGAGDLEGLAHPGRRHVEDAIGDGVDQLVPGGFVDGPMKIPIEIGRASWRERV